MKRKAIAKLVFYLLIILSTHSASADTVSPVSWHMAFENFDFLPEDFIHRLGTKTIEERKLDIVEGRFGKALYHGSPGKPYDPEVMSAYDLDLVTALIFDNIYMNYKGVRYEEPFFRGAGKIHAAYGAVAFWLKGPSKPGLIFEQASVSWGRTEKNLLAIELMEDASISAFIEDARYIHHTIRSKPLWKADRWNHIVFMWDRSSGLELWFNGEKAASSMGEDAWWETKLPGLFHCAMPLGVYDEFYSFSRTLTPKEIKNLYRKNQPPAENGLKPLDKAAVNRLKNAFSTDISSLPALRADDETALVFHEITPERIHDEGVQGWWIADGRYECAWPHDYTIFTVIPGDVDFHAEKADILPPADADINYVTFEGNLDGIKLFRGDRRGNFDDHPLYVVPETGGFFHGACIEGAGNGEFRIPFTKSYGVPLQFKSDVLKLPLSGNLRLHEVGIYNVSTKPLLPRPGDKKLYISPQPPDLDDTRYPVALKALLSGRDRTVAGLFKSSDVESSPILELSPMTVVNLLSEPAVGKSSFDHVILDMPVISSVDNNVLSVRLLDPAVPSHTWSHAEVHLTCFTVKPSRLRLALRFDPAFLVSGDRVWIQLFASDGFSIITGDREHPATVTLRPVIDRVSAELKYSYKTIRPTILTWGRMFEYIPWQHSIPIPDVDEPETFGGSFDMAYPWQAVLKVNPGDQIANFYRAFSISEYPQGRRPADLSKVKLRVFKAPPNAPEWAVYFREFQTFRNRIISWWRQHQRSDGQVGGGWNDDTLVFSRGYGDLPFDSNADALTLYNNVFNGFEKTNYFKDGYCRVWPIDQLHNGDFVRERYKWLIYNLGDPRGATWAMEEAWHWGKPDKTPVNYGDGSAFQFGKDALEWYWNKRVVEKPYILTDRDGLINTLHTAASVHNDTTFWRYTEAWVHTDDQTPYGSGVLINMLNGGWGETYRSYMQTPKRYDSQITITVGVGWPEGGGPDCARLVTYSGSDGLTVEMYSFDVYDRRVTARLFRIQPGIYQVTMSSDNDGNGSYETILQNVEHKLRRFDPLTFTVPPRTLVKLEIKQIRYEPEPSELPDLATSPYYIRKDGNSLVVTVHNIGNAPSGPFTVTVRCPRGLELAEVEVESLLGAQDFIPKQREITIPNLPDYNRYEIEIDRADTVMEIFEENNVVKYEL